MASLKSACGCFYFFVLNNGKNYFKNVENSKLYIFCVIYSKQ